MAINPFIERGFPDGLYFVTGHLGGGKSYYLALEVVRALRQGRPVVTNLELNEEACQKCLGWGRKFCPEGIVRLAPDWSDFAAERMMSFRNALVALDEAHIGAYCRETGARGKSLLRWATVSRKLGQRVLLATQDKKNVDVALTRLACSIYWCRDLSHVRVSGIYLFGRTMLRKTQDWDGTTLENHFFRLDPKICAVYDTTTLPVKADSQSVSVASSRPTTFLEKLQCLKRGLSL